MMVAGNGEALAERALPAAPGGDGEGRGGGGGGGCYEEKPKTKENHQVFGKVVGILGGS